MSAIDCNIVTARGVIQMNLSAENEVDTTNVDHTKNNAALVGLQDADVTRDDTKPCTFGYATR